MTIDRYDLVLNVLKTERGSSNEKLLDAMYRCRQSDQETNAEVKQAQDRYNQLVLIVDELDETDFSAVPKCICGECWFVATLNDYGQRNPPRWEKPFTGRACGNFCPNCGERLLPVVVEKMGAPSCG